MRLGIVTYQIAAEWDLPTLIDKCKTLGYAGMELRTTHAHSVEPALNNAQRAEVKQRIVDAGLTLWGLGTACEFHSTDAAEVREQVELAKRFVELAADVGAIGVKVRPNGLQTNAGVPVEKTLEQIAAAFRECGRCGGEQGVELWMEVHGLETARPSHMRSIIDMTDHENCWLCWNSNPTDLDDHGSIAASFDLLGKWVRSVHINDLWNTAYPWRDLFNRLKAAGYGDRMMLAEIGPSTDSETLLRYYRRLWEQLGGA